MRRDRFAKIVATLGPATSNKQKITELLKTGVDVFRLNFSHGDYSVHQNNIETIREAEKELNHPVTILLDLQGPKFRVGRFKNEKIKLNIGQDFTFDNNEELGNEQRVYLPHPEIFQAAKIGHRLLVDDARSCFEVIKNDGKTIQTKIIYGKAISNNKGVNLPDTLLDVPVLTPKDEKDLEFGLTQSIDFVALSFVQKASDMRTLRDKVKTKAAILAKIEKPSAVEDIENILHASDAIMLARGDLGVEFPPEQLPGIQRRIIRKARKIGKPIIVATQMLESMIDSPVATRAEATDVHTAIMEGADAVMLSGETAVGKYPIETVSFMNKMIIETERDISYQENMSINYMGSKDTTEDAISAGVKGISNAMPISAVVCFTTSGGTAKRIVIERALTPVFALTPFIHLARRMQLHWGINANIMAHTTQLDNAISEAINCVVTEKYAQQGDWVAITLGSPFGHSGTTNTLRLEQVK